MSDPIPLLTSIGQVLATMALYGDGHPARRRALDASYEQLMALTAADPRPSFAFLDGEVVYRRRVLREFKEWEWSVRFAAAGIERLEILDAVTPEEYADFLLEVYRRLAGVPPEPSEARQLRRSSIRFGAVTLRGEGAHVGSATYAVASLAYSLQEEVEGIEWVHQEVQRSGRLPLLETESLVRSLALAMHAQQGMVLPLLQLKEFDQYTTTHASNVAVLAMGLAEFLGLAPRDVRAMGVAGLLHDLGKVRIPHEILVKPGAFTEAERDVMQRHPRDGAEIILGGEQDLDLAAVVAFEHHMWLDGRGYPGKRFARDVHFASRLVHVCDVYDALCTNRPYRDAMPSEMALALIEADAGTSFDPAVVTAFAGMVRRATLQQVALESPAIRVSSPPAEQAPRGTSAS